MVVAALLAMVACTNEPEISIDRTDLQMDYKGFNNAPEIVIPPEALNAPEGGAFLSGLG